MHTLMHAHTDTDTRTHTGAYTHTHAGAYTHTHTCRDMQHLMSHVHSTLLHSTPLHTHTHTHTHTGTEVVRAGTTYSLWWSGFALTTIRRPQPQEEREGRWLPVLTDKELQTERMRSVENNSVTSMRAMFNLNFMQSPKLIVNMQEKDQTRDFFFLIE